MKTIRAAFFVATLAASLATPVMAQTIKIDFDGAAGYVNTIGNFYNGGTDGLGRTGPNYGVSFSDAAVALSNDALGPYYSNAPSGTAVMYAADSSAVMNVARGFTGGLSFFYSSTDSVLDAVKIYAGLNGTGTLLASASLFGNASLGCTDSSFCRFDLTNVQFAGIGRSVSFGGNAPSVVFDDVTITAVPEPSTWLMLAAGMVGVGFMKRRRQA